MSLGFHFPSKQLLDSMHCLLHMMQKTLTSASVWFVCSGVHNFRFSNVNKNRILCVIFRLDSQSRLSTLKQHHSRCVREDCLWLSIKKKKNPTKQSDAVMWVNTCQPSLIYVICADLVVWLWKGRGGGGKSV